MASDGALTPPPVPVITGTTPDTQPESFHKRSLELARTANRKLRAQLEAVEKENRKLKRSLYALSSEHNSLRLAIARRQQRDESKVDTGAVFDLKANLNGSGEVLSEPSQQDNADVFSRGSVLKSHTAAVYALQFSPCGRILASASFDRTVRLWDISRTKEPLLAVLGPQHRLSVTCLTWKPDSSGIVSGSHDGTIRLWATSVESLELPNSLQSWYCGGPIMCLDYSQERSLILAGTARHQILAFDVRQIDKRPCRTFDHDSAVSALRVLDTDDTVFTGDYEGMIKTWNLGDGKCINAIQNSAASSSSVPITHIARSRRSRGTYVAVNSYDDSMRLYDRSTPLLRLDDSHLKYSASKSTSLTLIHHMRAHCNRNWPIHNSIFEGRHYDRREPWETDDYEEELDDEKGDRSSNHMSRDRDAAVSRLDRSLLVASGSADHCAYVYDVSGPESTDESSCGRVLQRLEGHRGRVYAVDFHPHHAVLATAGSDTTIQIWAPSTSR